MTRFTLTVIGDEILHGSRQDRHFAYFKQLLSDNGLLLAEVCYLPDEEDALAEHLRRSFARGLPSFLTGGIGATPDDHTRQAAAKALGVPLVLHPEAAALVNAVSQQRGDAPDSPAARQRLHLAEFPECAALIPNPYNGIAGFSIRRHYFLPRFPVMAHPMAEWVLQHDFSGYLNQTERQSRAVWLFGLPESHLAPLMRQIEAEWPGIRSFSLPSVGGGGIPAHIEFGIKAEGAACVRIGEAWQAALELLDGTGAGICEPGRIPDAQSEEAP